jgi:hypothetical protein
MNHYAIFVQVERSQQLHYQLRHSPLLLMHCLPIQRKSSLLTVPLQMTESKQQQDQVEGNKHLKHGRGHSKGEILQ